QVSVPIRMFGRAALRRDDHVTIALLFVDERLRSRLTALSALRRKEQGLRASLPLVADLAPGFAVAPDVLFAEQVLPFAHWLLLPLGSHVGGFHSRKDRQP